MVGIEASKGSGRQAPGRMGADGAASTPGIFDGPTKQLQSMLKMQ